MGTHPKVPSISVENGKSLRELIESNPDFYLGPRALKEFGIAELPFLFKVLSIEKVLSIQAHPDKALAKILHANDPQNYPDDNHKPEMAIAVTAFEGFCGFKPFAEIASNLEHVPEFAELVGQATTERFLAAPSKQTLKLVFEKIMTASPEAVSSLAARLVARAAALGAVGELILRLNKQFPLDIGLFCGCLLLNYVKLEAGEAMFLKAKDPHAYILGNIIECMAASDNVVRSGFTPKFKDVKNLVEMLTYSSEPVEKQKMVPETFGTGDGTGKLYNPPIEEFAVFETKLDKGEVRKIAKLDSPVVLITTEGKGSVLYDGKLLPVQTGEVVYIVPGVEFELKGEAGFTSYGAFVY